MAKVSGNDPERALTPTLSREYTGAGVIRAYLASLLRTRLFVTEARRVKTKPGGGGMRDGVTPTPRLLLIRRGVIRYQIEDQSYRIAGPAMLLVPGHSRRQWMPERAGDVVYFSFETELPGSGLGPLIVRQAVVTEQEKAMRGLVGIVGKASPGWELLAEAEAKAILARFLLKARPLAMPAAASKGQDKRVQAAVRWLQDHLGDEDPLHGLHELAGLSAAYFRAEFRRLTDQTPSAYLNTLRMRAARFQLVETTTPIKQIARQVGFADPLYFSRRYQQFWKRSPSDERGSVRHESHE